MKVATKMRDGVDIVDHSQDGLNGADEFGAPWREMQRPLRCLGVAWSGFARESQRLGGSV